MECQHQAVTVWYSIAVRQGFDRKASEWYGQPITEQVRGIDHIECPECGKDLTDEFLTEIEEAF